MGGELHGYAKEMLQRPEIGHGEFRLEFGDYLL
jgi:hypothetical protein